MQITRAFLDQVAAEHGPSFYLLDSQRFQNNFTQLTTAFREHYPQTTIAYSYKTNYVPRFCQLVSQLGGYAEVVSSMEMTLALKIGVNPSYIFFNGPYKEHEYVIKLLRAGGVVNVDSWEELLSIAQSANNHVGLPYALGLRCNFDVGDGVLSRFGFDIESPVFIEAIKLIDQHPNLELISLHCHFATRSLECWKSRAQGMLALMDRFFSHRLAQLKCISLGGGMYGPMPEDLKAQFAHKIANFSEYAAAAAAPFAQYFSAVEPNKRPQLIIEPGTALVADAMKYVCQVNSIKQVRGQTVATLNGSTYNINPNPNRKNVPIECFSSDSSDSLSVINSANLAGYTCIESDYLYKDFSGRLAVGDFVTFDDVGSYSVVMKPPFILPNVAIIEPLLYTNSWRVIKRRESFDDVFSTYNFI